MKILILPVQKEASKVFFNEEKAISLLKNMEIPYEILDVKGEMEKQLGLFFNLSSSVKKYPTHVLVLSPFSPLHYYFFAGFSEGLRVNGSQIPFLVYGEEAIAGIPEDLASCFRTFKTEDALRACFEAERENPGNRETAKETAKSGNSLLDLGIPVAEKLLTQCVADGSAHEVSLFISAGLSPDTRNNTGVPLLNLAARKGSREVLLLLLNAGAHVSLLADDRGSSALMDAVLGKHMALINDLIEAGTDVNIQSKDGQTALIIAVGIGDDGIVETLLKAGADPDVPDKLGVSARKYAGFFHRKSHLELFDTYVKKKAD